MTFPLDAVVSGWVGISALGALLALDGTSVGQTMVSRPLVAGVLTGMLVGEPMFGAVIGAVLELYLLVSFPTGGSRFPEGATATVVAVGSTPGFEGGGALALAVAVGLVWGHVGGMSVTWLRRANERLVPGGEARPATPARVVGGHLTALGLDFLRGALVVATGLVVGRTLIVRLGPTWPLGVRDSFGLMLVGASVSLGILLRGFGGFRPNRWRLAVGIALGLLGARFL
jgi:mannose/fructose/N-acetylgalactosamine-specific phosphotransferase system component IIC